MGGFHASLCPEEVARYAEAVVVGRGRDAVAARFSTTAGTDGRASSTGARAGRPLRGLRPDRRIFRGKRYLPVGLVEAGRGCHFHCDFCAVQTVFGATQTRRPTDEIVAEVGRRSRTAG